MSQDNVTQITKHHSHLTLASVRSAINGWREARTRSNEKMPGYLWDQVLHLLTIESGVDSKILAALSLTVLSQKLLKSKNDYSPGELRQLGY